MTTPAGLQNFMDSLFANETHHLYKWSDQRDECVLAISAEFDNNRHACRTIVSTRDVYDRDKREAIKSDLRLQLLESMDVALKEYRRRVRRSQAEPPVIVRWTGPKSHVRILQDDEDVSKVLATRMVQDMNEPPLNRHKCNTPIEINWRKEGF